MAFCMKCGAEVPAGAQFCQKCGQAVAGGSAQGPQGPEDWREMRRAYRESRRAGRWGGYGGEGWGAWWSGSWAEDWAKRWSWMWSPAWVMLNAVFLGLFLVCLGLLMYLAASGVTDMVTWSNFWAYLIIALGALWFLRSIARYLVSKQWFGGHGIGWGIILMVLGSAALVGMSSSASQYFWTYIIVALGGAVILVGLVNYLFMKTRPRP